MLNADRTIQYPVPPCQVFRSKSLKSRNAMLNIRLSIIAVTMLIVTVRQNTSAQELTLGTSPVTMAAGHVKQSVTGYLNELQLAHESSGDVFVEMDDLNFLIREGGGGSCASAAGLIVLQTCRSACGLPTIVQPHRVVLESMKDQKALLNGRVTNSQFAKLIQFYASSLNGNGVGVSILSAPNSPHASDGNVWGEDTPLQISVRPNEITVLSYTVTTKDGAVLGRHFVVLKKVAGNRVHIVDPLAPTKPRMFDVEEGAGTCDRVFLRIPPGVKGPTHTNELNTVFRIRLLQSEVETPSRDSVELVKRQLDATAEELRAKQLFKSPKAWRSETASFGLPGLDLPLENGGAGWPATQMIEIFRHAGRHDLNLRDVVGGAHARILTKSSTDFAKTLIGDVVSGKAYIAITITEPDFGTDFTGMQTSSSKVDGGYILNGEKRYNARLSEATHVIVFTKSVSGKKGRLSVFAMPIETPGLKVEEFGAHGLTGNSYGGLKLSNLFVTDDQLIGNIDDGYKIFNEHFTYWRLMQVVAAIGTAEKALDMMTERLRTRIVYGGPIGRFTHLQQPLGKYTTQLKMAHSLAVEAAQLLDQGKSGEAAWIVCGLKAEAVEIALLAVDEAARAFGGEGYSDRVDIGDRLRDLNGLRIADGTTDAMRSAVVLKTRGKDFWEMGIDNQKK